jgi:hypothetical protein
MVTNAIIFLILLGLTALGYLFRVGLIVMVAGFGMMIFGFTLWALYTWLSIVIALVGGIIIVQGARS